MISKILVPIDLETPLTTQALCKTASEIASKFNAEIQVMTVIPDYGTPLVASFFPENAQNKIKEESRAKLANIVKENFSVETKIAVVKAPKRASAILSAIDEVKADLVMIGCRRKNSRNEQRLLGSTTMAVTDRAQCSVMVIRREVA